MTLQEGENREDSQEEIEILLPNTTIVTHCILKDDIPRLTKSFEDDSDPFKETIAELLNQRDSDGKSPLDIASTLGRTDMVRELLQRGADVNLVTSKGFCALHHAAAWGKLDVIKVLVEFHCNLQQRNVHGERARETAVRYTHTECVDYLDWAEAKVALLDLAKQTQETVQDPEKVQGRLTKEDKTISLSSCKEKVEWVESNPGATTQEFIEQKELLEEILGPIMLKLSEPPPEKPEKK
ncbi:ankyrin repeat domain-containing protein 45-like isoform X2 [Mercenaria mercenaria]|uniref:ankyrin repeat domain-containing protein 45-like isoform X2 n=1 Tax=Mercenaria mercenaria TaxID=6596 RepID=UPI001E1DDC28|nr:ankyrin repeat domain-containing protein 45-like isoform X2 [Mercenaria mercenaria]